MQEANAKNEFDAESSIDNEDRFLASDGTTWEVVDSHDEVASEEFGRAFASLTDVDDPECDRWMAVSEIAAKLDAGKWEVSK